jgi:AcrR family transcriptional regulator
MAGRVRQHDTEERVVSAALALFDAKGFGQVTMEEIAVAADVSRRTVYRRFPTKGHVVLAVPLRWLEVWDDAVETAAGSPPSVIAESASRAVGAYIDAHRADVLRAYSALAESPSLESAGTIHHEWISRIVALLQREPEPLSPATQHVVAGAYMGAIDAMLAQWVRTGGQGSVLQETEAVLDLLRPVWPLAA